VRHYVNSVRTGNAGGSGAACLALGTLLLSVGIPLFVTSYTSVKTDEDMPVQNLGVRKSAVVGGAWFFVLIATETGALPSSLPRQRGPALPR